ncbi:hypothetical protein BJX61DRAFT_309453 [Aspergillus egyptiacus]|nr:hypothetical protein BJX61DRAFT_309453 [Aspergillus egyptiacus]
MSVPPEDLQAFQAKHFPKSIQPPQPESNSHDVEEEEQNDEDDLGYYPDGVKRTLTDEQIRIFRHSEIHALLRERQIKAENEEYARRMGNNSEASAVTETVSPSPVEESAASDRAGKDKISDTQTVGVKRAADEGASGKQAAKRQAATAEVYLDYNEESAAQQSSRRPVASQFAGRRIISYDD